MAKNQEPEESSGSDELLSSESGSESGSGSESEQETSPPKPQNPPSSATHSSESDSESESKTPQKPKSSNLEKGSAVGVKRGAGKVAETPDLKKAKKVEVKKDGSIEDSSKKLFQRVFSEEDEIGLLKGMLDFVGKKKSDPVANIDEFVEFIKKKLHLDVTKAQLLNKMKRLKGKYKGNASKVKDGHDVKISRQHERESYELSKRIWGGMDLEITNGDGVLETTKVNGSVMRKCGNKSVGAKVSPKREDVVAVAVKPVSDDEKLKGLIVPSSGVTDGVSMYSSLEQRIMSEEIKNVDEEKRRELEKKLREIEVAELQLCAKRCEYMAEKARLLIDAKKAQL